MTDPKLWLKKGREHSVLLHHPWIYSGAVDRLEGAPPSGGTVDVFSFGGQWLAKAAYSPASSIRGRIWTWDANEVVDGEFFTRRLNKALYLRNRLGFYRQGGACRLVHGESDGLPGLVVDRYSDWLVIQVLSAGPEFWRSDVLKACQEVSGIDKIFERSDADVRKLEGLGDRVGSVNSWLPPGRILIEEKGHQYWVDIQNGQKTGFYIDQRLSRRWVRQWAGQGKVLNAFCYTGSFTVCALAGGALEVLSIDSSAPALSLAKENVTLNNLPLDRCQWMEGDVFQVLRTLRDRRDGFDSIILDPPKFAPSVAHVNKALRAYKDLNLLAFKLLNPGGILFTFSCSGGVTSEVFQKIVSAAAHDAGVCAQVIERVTQSPDHPVALNFPEGEYLKGLVIRKC